MSYGSKVPHHVQAILKEQINTSILKYENAQKARNFKIERMAKSLVISNESINSYGFWLLTAGADLKQYKKNPILLWMHNRAWRGTKEEVLPIGRIENLRVEGDKILGDPLFDMEDEFAAEIGRKWEKGFLKMGSAGIKVKAFSEEARFIKPGQKRSTVIKWVLREVSIVDIGSNDDSLAFYDEDDNLLELSDSNADDCPVKLLENPPTEQPNLNNDMEFVTLADGKKLNADQVQELSDKVATQETTITTLTQERDTHKQNEETLQGKVDAYELKEKTVREKEKTELLAAAKLDGRINKASEEHWVQFFDTNHEGAKLALAGIPKRENVSGKLGDQGNGNVTEREELAKLNWDELDKQGKLQTLKDNHYDLFEEKFEKKFGRKPSK